MVSRWSCVGLGQGEWCRFRVMNVMTLVMLAMKRNGVRRKSRDRETVREY